MSSMPPSQPARRPRVVALRWRTCAYLSRGRRARRLHPPSGRGPASTVPPAAASRSRSPMIPSPAPVSASVGARAGAAVADLDLAGVDTDLDVGAGRVLEHVRDRLLHDPVGGVVELDLGGADRQAGRPRPVQQRPQVVPALAEQVGQPRHLGQRLLAGLADGVEALARPLRRVLLGHPARARPGRPSPPGCGRRCRAAHARSGRARGGPRAVSRRRARPRARGCAARVLGRAPSATARRGRRATGRAPRS